MLDYLNSAVDFVKQFKPTTNYEIAGMTIGQEEIISEGGYGYVYLAHEKSNFQKKYALKKILIQDRVNQEAVKREVEHWSQLGDHKNICKYIGHIEQEDLDKREVIILCEYCSGGTLVDLLQRYDLKLVEEQIVYVTLQIWEGLKVMHEHSPPIAHRDIKVENILQEGENFKLADFGSWSTDTLDYDRDSKGTIVEKMELFEKYTTMMYRPPEMIDQYQRYPVGTQVDIWMLGWVLFTLWFAKHPFQEAQKLAIANAHYYIPDEDHDRIGTKLRDLIRLMLTPDPRKRPDINKIISILENWTEIDDIPLNDDAFNIKNKQEAISKARNKKYTDIAQTDLLGFESSPNKSSGNINSSTTHPAFKHSKSFLKFLGQSVGAPQVPQSLNTGWADFGKRTSAKIEDDTQDMFDFSKFSGGEKKDPTKEDNSWFDFEGGFGDANGTKNVPKNGPVRIYI